MHSLYSSFNNPLSMLLLIIILKYCFSSLHSMHKFFKLLSSLHLEHFSSQIGLSSTLSVFIFSVTSLILSVSFIFDNSVFLLSVTIFDSVNFSDSVILLESIS